MLGKLADRGALCRRHVNVPIDRRDFNAIAAPRLGEIERLVGQHNQVSQILLRIDNDRNTDAGRRMQCQAVELVRIGGKCEEVPPVTSIEKAAFVAGADRGTLACQDRAVS